MALLVCAPLFAGTLEQHRVRSVENVLPRRGVVMLHMHLQLPGSRCLPLPLLPPTFCFTIGERCASRAQTASTAARASPADKVATSSSRT